MLTSFPSKRFVLGQNRNCMSFSVGNGKHCHPGPLGGGALGLAVTMNA